MSLRYIQLEICSYRTNTATVPHRFLENSQNEIQATDY